MIIDIDGTLANVDHRLHHVEKFPKNWPAFFKAMVKDTVEEWCKLLCNKLPVKIILLTGRPAKYQKETEKWLKDNGIKYDLLLMRPTIDMRRDDVTKLDLYQKHVQDNYDVLFVVDDSERVVAMWRSLGLVCLQR